MEDLKEVLEKLSACFPKFFRTSKGGYRETYSICEVLEVVVQFVACHRIGHVSKNMDRVEVRCCAKKFTYNRHSVSEALTKNSMTKNCGKFLGL